MSRFLVVAAAAEEVAYLPDDVPVVVTGIGKVAAAAATARALALDPDPATLTVLNVGTAGALRDGVHGLFTPGTVINHDLSADALRALGYDPREVLTTTGDTDVVLASGDLFVTDPVVRDALAARAALVDMEGYAVAYAAQAARAAVELVKYVSDNADESAFDWPDLVDACARELGNWVSSRVSQV